MQYLKKLKIILPFKILILLLITIIYCFIYLNIKHESKYDISDHVFIGTINKMSINDNKLTIVLKGKEKLLVNYYYEGEIDEFELGDRVKVVGDLSIPNNNTNFNLFNYKKYLLSQRINYLVKAESIEIVNKNTNILYKFKNKLIERIDSIPNNTYLKAFILGDNKEIADEFKSSYQVNGISHLFAVSGMHIGFISSILFFLFKRFGKTIANGVVVISLLCFAFLVDFSPSVMRTVLFLILILLKEHYNLKISTFDLFIILTCSFLLYNPYYICNMGFLYSFIISGFLILYKEKLKSQNYFVSILRVSLLAFLASFPITIYYSFEINLLSSLLNLLFVPIVSFVIFPMSFIVLLFPFVANIYGFFINLLESLSLFFANIKIFNIILARPHISVIVLYYILVIIILKNKKNIVLLILIIVFHSNIHKLNNELAITMLDVGQGDSILIEFPWNKGNILIDTGGNYQNNSYIGNNITIPYMKSLGIKKISYLIITHGDYDHMGEAINLVENFKVKKVIFNCGEFNELEQELIKVLDKKKIPYYSCIKELNIDNNKLYFLNDKDYGNENDNSSVIYTELNNYKFLFMGDAGVEVEEELIEKYNLEDVDVLKVGHHGSKTSSSQKFINEINPKYSIISVGKNNRYGHPNDSVLEILDDSKIYRTDQDGSIMFKIKNNKIQIETCTP